MKVTFSILVETNPYGNFTATCLDSRYDAIFISGLMLLSADPYTTIYPVKQKSEFIGEDGF